ncbi:MULTISPECIES: DUF4412 domain-containing protein [unclassified Lentimicrobium]|uniref:DUF4412 domain-containing protein n=1 Tax=unclassified Lentimicrobium TaxID=2677434 RepID=UPI00155471A8|nr:MULTISPECIES: DUF4412 domain-containing protein [unclassified Lentimicrobium]NPD44633.1 hypothetical protein [Lentimicrobium sp. S6]NPD83345.1 hypothetical protein [Lentimicrobium sp. L6]
MRKFILLSIILCFAFQVKAQNQAKRFAIKSGRIILELSGSTTGTKTIFFDNYGDKYHEHEKSVTEVKMFGITDRTNVDKITIMNGERFWTIDNIEGDNMEGNLPYYKSSHQMVENMSEAEQKKMADDLLKAMGGQKLGTEEVLGYDCEKMSVMGSEIWVYKGITLKSEANIMGIISNEVAIEFEKNPSLSDEIFEAPEGKEFENLDELQQAAFGGMDMSMSMEEEEYEDDDIVAVTYPFDKFQKVINGFNPEGYVRAMVMQQDGQHVAIYMQGFGNIISVMATSDENLVDEQEDFAQFESFRHDGKTMRFGDLTTDGTVGKALIIPYEEHDMYILLLSAPGKSKEALLDMADELDF